MTVNKGVFSLTFGQSLWGLLQAKPQREREVLARWKSINHQPLHWVNYALIHFTPLCSMI